MEAGTMRQGAGERQSQNWNRPQQAGNRMQEDGGTRPEHSEGTVARMIEQQTAKLPSDLFLWAAGGAIVGSLTLHCAGKQHMGLMVGQWVPTLLILGLYNKLVKVAGSDPVPRSQ